MTKPSLFSKVRDCSVVDDVGNPLLSPGQQRRSGRFTFRFNDFDMILHYLSTLFSGSYRNVVRASREYNRVVCDCP